MIRLSNILNEIRGIMTEKYKLPSDITVYSGDLARKYATRSKNIAAFSPEEHQTIYRWMEKNRRTVKEMDRILDTLKDGKYTDTLVIKFKNYMFGIYSHLNRFQLAGGGGMDTAAILEKDNVKNDFIEAIK